MEKKPKKSKIAQKISKNKKRWKTETKINDHMPFNGIYLFHR